MKKIVLIVTCIVSSISFSQMKYTTPSSESLPEKLQNLKRDIVVKSFPEEIDPIKIKGKYYWKHNTVVFSKQSQLKIIEFGAYLFYNGKWNLRKSYPLKDFNKNFGTKKQIILQAQPYTWNNNWRIGSQLFGGWAMWYFIGVDENGKKICGYEKINTTNNLIK